MIDEITVRENADYKLVASIENGQLVLKLFNLMENRLESQLAFNKDEIFKIVDFLSKRKW